MQASPVWLEWAWSTHWRIDLKPLPSHHKYGVSTMRTLYRLTLTLPLLVLGFGFLPAAPAAAEALTACLPSGGSSQAMTETWTNLPHGESVVFHCSASANQSYRFDLSYDGSDRLPGDAGSYIAIESYRLNHVGLAWADRQSEANGNDRETVARTADMDETWMIKVTNTATTDAYDTAFWLSSTLLTGSD